MQLMQNGRKGNCAARPKKGVHQFALGGVGESDARLTTLRRMWLCDRFGGASVFFLGVQRGPPDCVPPTLPRRSASVRAPVCPMTTRPTLTTNTLADSMTTNSQPADPLPRSRPSFSQQLDAARANAAATAQSRAQGEARTREDREARAEADARAKAILAALRGRPTRAWDQWISTPEILDALNLPRGRKAYALIETTMCALGWTAVHLVWRAGRPRYYHRPKGYARGRRAPDRGGPPGMTPAALDCP
jgi:hypothetical protein